MSGIFKINSSPSLGIKAINGDAIAGITDIGNNKDTIVTESVCFILRQALGLVSSGVEGIASSVAPVSGSWDDVYSTVNANSASWEESPDITYLSGILSGNTLDITYLSSLSGIWQGTYSTVLANSASWEESPDITYLSGILSGNTLSIGLMAQTSGNWDSTYSTVLSNSASWNSSADISYVSGIVDTNIDAISDMASASGNWNSVHSTVIAYSGDWESVHMSVVNTSGNWDSTYSTVLANSASWEESPDINYLSGIVSGNTSMISELSAYDTSLRIFTIGMTGSNADYICDGTTDNAQFTQAISDMSPGDTLKILSGSYAFDTTVTINKSINFLGIDRSLCVLSVSGNYDCVDITAAGVTVEFLKFEAKTTQTVAYPLVSTTADKTVISNCYFRCNIGISVGGSTNYVTIIENYFETNSNPIGATGSIRLASGSMVTGLTIHRNVSYNNHYALYSALFNVTIMNMIVTENIFTNQYPISLNCASYYISISDNYLYFYSSFAISIADVVHANTYVTEFKITDNIITGHPGTTVALILKSMQKVIVSGNTFKAPASAFNYITMGDGLAGQGVLYASIIGNVFGGATSGGVVESGSSDYNILQSNNNIGTVTLVGANSIDRDANLSSVYSTVLSNSASWEESADIAYVSGIVDNNTDSINYISGEVTPYVISVSGNYDILTSDEYVLANPISGNILLTLPDISAFYNPKLYWIKRILDNANTVTLSAYGSQTIDLENTQPVDAMNCINIISNDSRWHII